MIMIVYASSKLNVYELKMLIIGCCHQFTLAAIIPTSNTPDVELKLLKTNSHTPPNLNYCRLSFLGLRPTPPQNFAILHTFSYTGATDHEYKSHLSYYLCLS